MTTGELRFRVVMLVTVRDDYTGELRFRVVMLVTARDDYWRTETQSGHVGYSKR